MKLSDVIIHGCRNCTHWTPNHRKGDPPPDPAFLSHGKCEVHDDTVTSHNHYCDKYEMHALLQKALGLPTNKPLKV